jgi:hypothetical protein
MHSRSTRGQRAQTPVVRLSVEEYSAVGSVRERMRRVLDPGRGALCHDQRVPGSPGT